MIEEALRKESMAKIAKIKNEAALKERSGALCEVCGKAGPLVIHHIMSRRKPKGFKTMPEIVQELWPEIEFLTIVICLGAHRDGSGRVHTALRHNAPALLALLLVRYSDRMWEGKTYLEWFLESPFKEWL